MTTVKDTGPLTWNVPIVVPSTGLPTLEFQRRWETQRANNAAIGTITFGSGPPTGTPEDGAEYVDTSADPQILYIGSGGVWSIIGVQDFIDLGDVPSTYTGAGSKLTRVNSGATGLEFANLSTILDGVSNVQGSILYRNASGWVALTPGTAGDFLKTQGAAANPVWASVGGLAVIGFQRALSLASFGSALIEAALGIAWTIPASLTSSVVKSDGTAPSAQTDFDLQAAGVSIGTIRFASGANTATFIKASSSAISANTTISIMPPATLNGMTGNLFGSIAGTR